MLKKLLILFVFHMALAPYGVFADTEEESNSNAEIEEPQAETEAPEDSPEPIYTVPEGLDYNVEWFSLRIGGGLYGGGGDISLITLRWKYFFWESLRVNYYYGGPPQIGDGDNRRQGGLGGTVGFPLIIDKLNNHEIRFGVSFYIGAMEGGDKDSDCVKKCECKENTEMCFDYDCKDKCDYEYEAARLPGIGLGFILAPEIYYLFHASKDLALQVGATLYIPLRSHKPTIDKGIMDIFSKTYYPTPSPIVYVGFRI